MTRWAPRAAWVSLAFGVIVACGGGAKEARAPESAPSPGYAPATPAAQPPPAPPTASAPAGGSVAGQPSREMAVNQAKGDLDTAQRELDVAAGDCGAACRALGSMDRAAGHLCGMAQEQGERDRCEDAKTRVRRARDKVKATCGSCPGGPSVDRNAPVPSGP
jgi:hypothetical protein